MTYNVFSGTLNPTQSTIIIIDTSRWFIVAACQSQTPVLDTDK